LTLHLYFDDCLFSHRLRDILAAEYEVTVPADVGLTGARDEDHFAYAQAHGLIILTKNPDDFRALHVASPAHSGVFAVCQDNDPTRDMTPEAIRNAIANIVASGIPIAAEFHILNHWRY
jgi:predicted nuclease of predicted toxin-antitoxin system